MRVFQSLLAGLLTLSMATVAAAQEATVAFGSQPRNPDDPVEVTSEQLAVNENDRIAVFTEDVVVGQGEMRLFAPKVEVFFKEEINEIDWMEATGGVTLLNGEDEAEADRAEYYLDDGRVEMFDNVLLKQELSTISSDRMTAHLDDGTAVMRGNVKSIFQSNSE